MPGGDRAIFSLLIEVELLTKKGQEFEDFFSRAGTLMWGTDFEPWRTQGRLGDMKCDGYRVSDSTVFQCYAPERFEPSKVVSKIQTDFSGARDNFKEKIQRWVFVHNQRDGLPVEANRLLAELRDGHPGIEIEIWRPEDLIHKLLDLSDAALGKLFRGLGGNQNLSTHTLDTLERYAKKSRVSAPGTDSELCGPVNFHLNAALDDLDEVDRDVRRRILGYSMWYEPATHSVVYEKMAIYGHNEAVVQANSLRLHEAGIIQVTENYFLPANEKICQEAAETMMTEFLEELEGSSQ